MAAATSRLRCASTAPSPRRRSSPRRCAPLCVRPLGRCLEPPCVNGCASTIPVSAMPCSNCNNAASPCASATAGWRLTVESAKREAADLRALLRYLHVVGVLEADLGTAMPPVATWRGATLPPTMSRTDVERPLASCDRSTTSGRRDLTVLALLARLGFRAAEVAALELGDVDWRVGEILVWGKAGRKDQLPLPVEVGRALVDYLRHGRPSCECRCFILTLYAPRRPIHPSSITTLVYRACRHAGLARVGAHRVRHALATEMLRQAGWRPAGNRLGGASVGPRHHSRLREGRPRCAAQRRRWLAGDHGMSVFARHLEDYLRLRRALGHQLADAGRLLPDFVAHLNATGASTITIRLPWPGCSGPTPTRRVRCGCGE